MRVEDIRQTRRPVSRVAGGIFDSHYEQKVESGSSNFLCEFHPDSHPRCFSFVEVDHPLHSFVDADLINDSVGRWIRTSR